MNKTELVEKIAEGADLSKKDAEKALAVFIDTVKKSVKKGDSVQLVGFGTFARVKVPARKGTIMLGKDKGKEWKKPAHNAPKFKAGQGFKDLVSGGK